MHPAQDYSERPMHSSEDATHVAPAADLAGALDGLDVDENVDPDLDMAARSNEAHAVRRQVDFYFSDDNLLSDSFLLGKMKGRKNKQLPLTLITSFSKMREYQPLDFVAEALKASQSVNVFRDNGVDWYIQRKEPFVKPAQLKTTGKLWAKPSAASGFEDYYTEGPLPPDVAAEEAEIYNEDNTFEERMEHAVQKYISRRKFNSTVNNIFTKWMRFGGVDVQPHAHVNNSLDPAELEGLTNKEKKLATAPKPYLAGEELDEKGNPKWVVDFEAVTKSFLSSMVPEMFSLERRDQYYELTNVMRNFLRYLQYHRVCPEHNAAINASIRICNQAERELPACETLQTNLPGNFNTAASTLFGGSFHDAYVGDQEWARDALSQGIDISHGLSCKNARQLFATGLVAFEHSKPNHGRKLQADQIFEQRISSHESSLGLEIVEVRPLTESVIKLYSQIGASFEPLGHVICKAWNAPDHFEWDLPPHIQPSKVDQQKTYTFLLEETLLASCVPGIKLENASVITLEPSGIQVLDSVPSHTRASFYTILENELVQKWKEPRFISRAEQKEREEALAAWRAGPGEGVTQEEMERMQVASGGGSSDAGADDELD